MIIDDAGVEMPDVSKLLNSEAIVYLMDYFRNVGPNTMFRVRLIGVNRENRNIDTQAKVTIAGFSEERRKSSGRMDDLREKAGSVSLYGDERPDHCLLLEIGGKHIVFMLGDVTVQLLGFGQSIIRLSSPSWKKAVMVELYIKKIYAARDAIHFFKSKLEPGINRGEIVSRLGKWVSKKVFDRDLTRNTAEKMAVDYYLKSPESETIRTTHIGGDIKEIEVVEGSSGANMTHTLKTRQQYDSTSFRFSDMVIEYETPGKEIGTKSALSTYVYFIGAPFNSPANLLIIRHRAKDT